MTDLTMEQLMQVCGGVDPLAGNGEADLGETDGLTKGGAREPDETTD